jgi:diguanylate cyclase (GGDEF)-like protein
LIINIDDLKDCGLGSPRTARTELRKPDRRVESLVRHLVPGSSVGEDQRMGGNGTVQGGSAMDDDLHGAAVVDELTGLANRQGFIEMLRMEERRRARYGGSPTLMMVDVERSIAALDPMEQNAALIKVAATLADATRDTDTLGRVGDYRFALLAIDAGEELAPIAGRLRLFLEMHGIQATVTPGSPGRLDQSWRELESGGTGRPTLRLIKDE